MATFIMQTEMTKQSWKIYRLKCASLKMCQSVQDAYQLATLSFDWLKCWLVCAYKCSHLMRLTNWYAGVIWPDILQVKQ